MLLWLLIAAIPNPNTGNASGNSGQGQIPGKIINPVSCGADPSGATDSATAINTCITKMSGATVGTLSFQPGTYKLSAPIDVVRRIIMTCNVAATNGIPACYLAPDVGVTAIIVHSANDGTVDGGTGAYSEIRDLTVVGTQASNWTASTTTALNSWVQPTAYSQYVFKATARSGDFKTNSVEPTWPAVVFNSDVASSVGSAVVDNHVTWTAAYQTGIYCRATCNLRDVSVQGISGDGISIVANAGASPATNANISTIDRAHLQTFNGNAFYLKGNDANAGTFTAISADTEKGWGVRDSSFLGNTHIGDEVSGAGLGAYESSDANSSSIFLGCYAESDGTPASFMNGYSEMLGGIASGSVTVSNSGFVQQGTYSTGRAFNINKATPFMVSAGAGSCNSGATSGVYNTCIGTNAGSGITTGTYNVAEGDLSLASCGACASNMAIGHNALSSCSGAGCSQNVAIGFASANSNNASFGTFVGYNAGASTTGNYNVAIGYYALQNNASADGSTAIGANALFSSTIGPNIGIGLSAGNTITTGINNIEIGNPGTSGDTAAIKIGTHGTQTSAMIAGIDVGASIAGAPVYVDSNGVLSSTSSTNQSFSSFAAVGSTPSNAGASNSGTVITLQPADGTHPGLLTALAQTIAGIKTFSSAPVMSGASITSATVPLATLVTQPVTALAAIGATPNANAGSISTNTLTIQPANGSFGGVVTTAAQTFAGVKTFSSAPAMSGASITSATIPNAAMVTTPLTALTGNVTASGGGSQVATIAANAVTNAKLATMTAATVKANITGGSAVPTDVGLVAAPTVSTAMFRDANANVQANNFTPNWATTVSSASQIVLNANSAQQQFVTGSTLGERVFLPDETTLSQTGYFFVIENNASVVVTVVDYENNDLFAMPASTRAIFTVTSIASDIGGWDYVWSYNLASRAVTGISAAGTTQADCTQLAAGDHWNVTTVAANTGVCLPPTLAGAHFVVHTSGANSLKIYANPGGGTLNAQAASAAITLTNVAGAAPGSRIIDCYSSTICFSAATLPDAN